MPRGGCRDSRLSRFIGVEDRYLKMLLQDDPGDINMIRMNKKF